MILRVVYTGIIASALVSVAFSCGVVGLIRGSELRRGGRGGAAAAYTTLAVLALVVCAAAVVYGLILVGQKN